MKLSTKGRYGLRAMIDLARFSAEEPVSINSIAARQGISESYLEQIVSLLKKAGLVRSVRGAGGGYVLEKDMKDISVGDVLRALEGGLVPVKCAAFHEGKGCVSAGRCVTKNVWQRINDSISTAVDGISIYELVEESVTVDPNGETEEIICEI